MIEYTSIENEKKGCLMYEGKSPFNADLILCSQPEDLIGGQLGKYLFV
jgi:hypothetical protein